MRLAAVYLLALCFGLCFIGIVGFELLARSKVDPVVLNYQGIQKQFLQTYIDDLDYLEKYPLFAHTKGQHNAGPFLNKILTWIPLESNPTQAKSPISAKVREQILRSRHDWMQRHERYKKLKLEFGFFSELSKYDYWDIEDSTPVNAIIAKQEFVPPPQFPSPDALELTILARLRLLQIMNNKKKEEALIALQEVRQLAKLLMTTENLSLLLAGISIFEIERQAYRHFVDTRILNEADWQPLNRNVTRRANRALWATRGYLRLWTSPEILRNLFLNRASVPLGICAGLNESLPNELALRSLLYNHIPLERDYRSSYKLLTEIYEKHHTTCRWRYLQTLLQKKDISVDYPVPILLTLLPYSRKVYGLQLSTNGFIGFEGYQTKAATGL